MRWLLLLSLVWVSTVSPVLAATVAGTVSSSAAGDPLLGVTISVNGKTLAETNSKGEFTIEAKAGAVIRAGKTDYVGVAALTTGSDETLTFVLAPIWNLTSITQIYRDVAMDSWYAESVQSLYEEQVLSATKSQLYRPSDSLTRAELANFAVLAAGFLPPSVQQTDFCDVKIDTWYTPAVELMYTQQWIGGYSTLLCSKGRDFRPGNPVTRAEAVKMILSVFGDLLTGKQRADCNTTQFTDIEPTAWYADYVSQAACLGIVSGYDDSTFRPQASINRAEIAVILSNTLKALR